LSNQSLICLGKYDNIEAKWRCVQRVKHGTDPLMMYHTVRENGVYAVIFQPEFDPANRPKNAYCGYLCKDRRAVMSAVIFTLPMLLLALNLFYKL